MTPARRAADRRTSEELIAIAGRLSRAVGRLSFDAPVDVVYNPIAYARRSHEAYLSRYAHHGCDALLVGMNPGPYGMAQTGVPFGEVSVVRDFLGIDETVDKPRVEHPKRPVLGMGCTRSEVSGRRLWGWAEERFGSAARFARHFFVWNYCPLVFMEDTGRNRTPDKLPRDERLPLEKACDRALADVVTALAPQRVIGVGRFATDRATRVLDAAGIDLPIGMVLHPSPASPIANRGWAPQAEAQLSEFLGTSMDDLAAD